MNNTFYFQHDYNAHEDEKIIDLWGDHGWQGYGLYWRIIEMLAQNNGYLKYNCKRIALALQVDSNCIESIISNYSLFSFKGGYFYSKRLLSQINYRQEIKEKRKKAAEKRWNGGGFNAKAMQVQCKSNAGAMQNDAKERKGKESKENGNKGGAIEFQNSPYYNFEAFKENIGNNYQKYDLKNYYEKVKNWAESKGVKRKDWLAQARNFILKDINEGKAVLNKKEPLYQDPRGNTM